MKLLLDTHAFIWMVGNESKLSGKAREAMANKKNDLFFSAASYWEICIKSNIGKLTLGENWIKRFDREMEFNNIQWLPIRKQHSQTVCLLPGIHKDPFDRMLIAQTQWEKMAIVTADRLVQKYPVKWIW